MIVRKGLDSGKRSLDRELDRSVCSLDRGIEWGLDICCVGTYLHSIGRCVEIGSDALLIVLWERLGCVGLVRLDVPWPCLIQAGQRRTCSLVENGATTLPTAKKTKNKIVAAGGKKTRLYLLRRGRTGGRTGGRADGRAGGRAGGQAA